MVFGESMRRTATETELDLVVELAVRCSHCAVCWSHYFIDLHFTERSTAENFSWASCWPWSPLLTPAEAEAWLSLLGSATAADLCLLSRLYRTGLLVYL